MSNERAGDDVIEEELTSLYGDILGNTNTDTERLHRLAKATLLHFRSLPVETRMEAMGMVAVGWTWPNEHFGVVQHLALPNDGGEPPIRDGIRTVYAEPAQ